MKILIVSDSHNRINNMKTILDKVSPIDVFIHLGDVERSVEPIKNMVKCPMHMVSGNNDYDVELPKEEVFILENHRIFITHGHRYHVIMGTDEIKKAARSRGVDVVMFGHTHRPYFEKETDLITLNPGSVSFPRQSGWNPTYMIMEIDGQGQMHFTLNYLNKKTKRF